MRGLRLAEGFDDVQRVEVQAVPGDGPLYVGSDGLRCAVPNEPRFCPEGLSIFFQTTDADRLANPIWIVRLRKPGTAYAEGDVWEGMSLPLEALPARLAGRVIATLDQRDDSGREGHYYCEVALDLPQADCEQFPSPPSATGASASAISPAQCPKMLDDGSLVSAIDGQVLVQAHPAAAKLRVLTAKRQKARRK